MSRCLAGFLENLFKDLTELSRLQCSPYLSLMWLLGSNSSSQSERHGTEGRRSGASSGGCTHSGLCASTA